MSWQVRWSNVCDNDVRRMHWRLATRICAAVLKYAETGRGTIERESGGYRIRVNGAVALAHLDVTTRTIDVRRIFAVR